MCDWNDTVILDLPAGHPTTREDRTRTVDRCLAPLVEVLNAVGMWTTASCCGHGRRPGTVALVDGREIHVFPDFATGRRVDALFPYPINDRRAGGVHDRRQNGADVTRASTEVSGWLLKFGAERRLGERRKRDIFAEKR